MGSCRPAAQPKAPSVGRRGTETVARSGYDGGIPFRERSNEGKCPQMGSVSHDVSAETMRLLGEAARLAEQSGAFAEVRAEGALVTCRDPIQPDASFRIEAEGSRVYVTWTSPNRYLSQSIEAELMWTGDDLDDLIDEEVADQGRAGSPLGRVEHFRNEEKLFTFRSVVPLEGNVARDAAALCKCLLAYQAAFRDLGDMKAGDEGE